MDQNQTDVDNDLQKAIDDITKTTNTDPVFSDPIAPPPFIPTENNTNELPDLSESIQKETKVQMVTSPSEPIAPLQSTNIPELNNPPSFAQPTVSIPTESTLNPNPIQTQTQIQSNQPADANPTSSTPVENNTPNEIKKAALRDLVPILDRININPSQKFRIYKDIFEDLKDTSVIDKAYQAAKELSDETERAEALLYLIEAIDKM